MRILFFTLHWGYLRHYDAALRVLADQGHEILLVAEKEDKIGSFRMIEDICSRYPNVSYEYAPDRSCDPWLYVATWIRLGLDYLRYLRPEYERFPKLWQRSRSRTPRTIVWLAWLFRNRPAQLDRLQEVLRTLEQMLPVPADLEEFLAARNVDAVLLTPLLGLGTSQYDALRAAKDLRLKTVLCVGSWDHLSSKALIRFSPDLVTLWNETQKLEAVEMHGIPSERIAVTGAQGWDRWFEMRPSRSREEFCREVGLDPEQPYFLWLCSTPFPGSPPEADLVYRWIEHLRSCEDPAVADAGVLIRPHPQRMAEWEGLDLASFGNVALRGDNPVTVDSRNDYYDSMSHCTAAIGLNTSAMIEAGILGRPVHTIFAPEFHDSQIQTVHFHYLREVGGGLLYESVSFEDNAAQLGQAIAAGQQRDPRSDAFTLAFVRPHGLEQPGTPRLVAAIESLLDSAEPIAEYEVAGSPRLRRRLQPVLKFLYVTIGSLRITSIGMRMHRGKKLFRARLLRIGKLFARAWADLRRKVRYARKRLGMARYRFGKRVRAAFRRLQRTGARAARRTLRWLLRPLRWVGRRVRNWALAAQRLLVRWLRPGDTPVE